MDTHENILKSVEKAGCFDGLEVCNLMAMEVSFRQAQLIEYVYLQETAAKVPKGKGTTQRAGLFDEHSIFTGSHRESGEAMIAPDLMDYVAKEVERDASILKQVRKAREERKALKGKEGDG